VRVQVLEPQWSGLGDQMTQESAPGRQLANPLHRLGWHPYVHELRQRAILPEHAKDGVPGADE
jgi:hypothetical protein